MPRINAPKTFVSYPTHRVFGIVDSEKDADAVLTELDRLDVEDDTWIMKGRIAEKALNSTGRHGGVFASLVRAVQSIGYESAQLATYERAAMDGSWIIAPKLGNDADPHLVSDIFARHNGREVRYMGGLGIVNLHNATSAL